MSFPCERDSDSDQDSFRLAVSLVRTGLAAQNKSPWQRICSLSAEPKPTAPLSLLSGILWNVFSDHVHLNIFSHQERLIHLFLPWTRIRRLLCVLTRTSTPTAAGRRRVAFSAAILKQKNPTPREKVKQGGWFFLPDRGKEGEDGEEEWGVKRRREEKRGGERRREGSDSVSGPSASQTNHPPASTAASPPRRCSALRIKTRGWKRRSLPACWLAGRGRPPGSRPGSRYPAGVTDGPMHHGSLRYVHK